MPALKILPTKHNFKRSMFKVFKNKKEHNELLEILALYSCAWGQWCEDEQCCLSTEEIARVNRLMKNHFRPTFFESYTSDCDNTTIETINAKLKSNYDKFKEWLIFKFLCQVIEMAKKEGSKNCMFKPIDELQVPGELKKILKKFRTRNIRDLGVTYGEADFKNEYLFGLVKEFYQVNKDLYL